MQTQRLSDWAIKAGASLQRLGNFDKSSLDASVLTMQEAASQLADGKSATFRIKGTLLFIRTGR